MPTEIHTIQSILQGTPVRWLSLVQATPEALLNRPPAPGHWTALACLQHLIDAERVLQLRLRAFLEGWESFPGFNPDAEGSQLGAPPSAQSLVGEFAALRATSLQAIGQIQPSDLSRRCRHQELGMVSLEQMLNEWPAHDLNHTIQAERALMQPFIEGCGPWQQYFTDHIVRPAA